MLLWLSQYLSQYVHAFQVFHYLTMRAIVSVLTAFGVSVLLGPLSIRWLTHFRVGQVIRELGPKSHYSKSGTPTMGGILILGSILMTCVLWGDWSSHYLWVGLGMTLGCGLLGSWDDWSKLRKQNTRGLIPRYKLLFQWLMALAASGVLYRCAQAPAETQLLIPFFKEWIIPLGAWVVLWSAFVMVSASNAVNLTDGLDGLAILPTVLVAAGLGIFAYLTGHAQFSKYLYIPFIPGVGELVILCGAIVGAGLGFLWFNTYPAQVFMGDMGSLGLGAGLGAIAVMVRQEFVLAIMGGIFVLETVSVILQVLSFKLTGKRIFKMAPIHHHFELLGWPEPRVIVRFWIISFILMFVGLATLKLR